MDKDLERRRVVAQKLCLRTRVSAQPYLIYRTEMGSSTYGR